eukprot:1607201-Rhodomonas_salina.2
MPNDHASLKCRLQPRSLASVLLLQSALFRGVTRFADSDAMGSPVLALVLTCCVPCVWEQPVNNRLELEEGRSACL